MSGRGRQTVGDVDLCQSGGPRSAASGGAAAVMTIPTPRLLHPSIGAEICGLDLREALSADTRTAVAAALAEHLVLVFRDQNFTPAE